MQLSRQETIEILADRDGYVCMFPECDRELTDDGRHMVTLDHIYPQALARRDGWTTEQINSVDNLQLMGKDCNARKGHLLYDEDGNLPLKQREPKALAKSERPAICETCFAGRILLPGEECYDCGSGPQPATAPTALQKTPKECDHSVYHCWMCYIGFVERGSAFNNIVTGT